MKKIFILALFVAAFLKPLHGSDAAGEPGAFLRYGLSAGNIAMGRTYTAIGIGAESSYCNPAAAVWQRSSELQAGYSTLYEDTADSYLNASRGIFENSAVSFSFIERKLENFEERDNSNQPGRNLNLSENALILSFANQYQKHFSWGLGIKKIYQNIGGFTGGGAGVDAGLMFQLSRSLRTGITVKNLIEPEITLNKYPEKYPLEKRIGIAYFPRRFPLLFSFDLQQIKNYSPDYFCGISFRVINNLSLRFGVNKDEITSGIGFLLRAFQIDFAFVTHTLLGNTQRLSVSYFFGEKNQFKKIDNLLLTRNNQEEVREEAVPDTDGIEDIKQRISALENKIEALTESYTAMSERWVNLTTKILAEKSLPEKQPPEISAEVLIARSISKHQAVDAGTNFSKDVGILYCWSLIRAGNIPVTIKHIWYFENKKIVEIPLIVKSKSYRTFSSKEILPEWTGQWRVDIVDDNNKVIQTAKFSVQ